MNAIKKMSERDLLELILSNQVLMFRLISRIDGLAITAAEKSTMEKVMKENLHPDETLVKLIEKSEELHRTLNQQEKVL